MFFCDTTSPHYHFTTRPVTAKILSKSRQKNAFCRFSGHVPFATLLLVRAGFFFIVIRITPRTTQDCDRKIPKLEHRDTWHRLAIGLALVYMLTGSFTSVSSTLIVKFYVNCFYNDVLMCFNRLFVSKVRQRHQNSAQVSKTIWVLRKKNTTQADPSSQKREPYIMVPYASHF